MMHQSKPVAQAVIVGCGNIGSMYDEGASESDGPILTHASAYARCGEVDLVGVCDVDERRAKRCGSTRGVQGIYTNCREMFSDLHPDIVSICTPTPTHAQVLEAALDHKIPVVFCEKPFTDSPHRARELLRRAESQRTVVAVNYFRRWAPGISGVLEEVKAGEILGGPQGFTARYGKGLLNCGSHLIDLILHVFGPPDEVQSLGCVGDDVGPGDATLNLAFRYEGSGGRPEFSGFFQGIDHRHYFCLELDIIGTSGRVRITDRADDIELYTVTDDTTYPGYRILRETGEVEGESERAILVAVEELASMVGTGGQARRHLSGCSGAEAVAVLDVVRAAFRSEDADGASVEVDLGGRPSRFHDQGTN